MTSLSEIPLPDHIQPHVGTSLAWDNVDRLEETLSGEGTSHRLNGIAVQGRHFGPQLSPEPSTQIVQAKKRSVEALDAENLGMHAFTGCDTVSAVAGRLKITASRLVKQKNILPRNVQAAGDGMDTIRYAFSEPSRVDM